MNHLTTIAQLDKERERLRRSQGTDPPILPPPDFPVNANFSLDAELSAYVLTIEIQVFTPYELKRKIY